MGLEHIHGKMVENMLVPINLIKNVVLVSTFGMMAEFMKDFGQMVKEMEMGK